MGRLFKRGDTWYADYRDANNNRIKTSLKTSDRQIARARLRDAELGTTGQAAHPPKALGAAVNDMIALKKPTTAGAYKGTAGHLFRLLGVDTDINTLTRAQVGEYCTTRLGEGAVRHTISKELTTLRQALKEAKARGEFIGSLDVVPSWKADYEPETRWLTPQEFARLLAAVKPERRVWLMIQAYTGAELAVMKRFASLPRGGWEHVDLARGTITLPGTKRHSRYRVDVPVHPALLAVLKKLDAGAPLIARWTKVHKHLRDACDAAEIKPRATTHDLRRTFGSWMVQAGVDLHHVARLMGNTAAMVSRVYGQTSDASYTAAIRSLPKLARVRKVTP
jgi:integrase